MTIQCIMLLWSSTQNAISPDMRIMEVYQERSLVREGLKEEVDYSEELKELIGLGYLKKKGKHVLCERATSARGKCK